MKRYLNRCLYLRCHFRFVLYHFRFFNLSISYYHIYYRLFNIYYLSTNLIMCTKFDVSIFINFEDINHWIIPKESRMLMQLKGATEFDLILWAIISCILTIFVNSFNQSCSKHFANKLCKEHFVKPCACAVTHYLVK